MYSTELESKLWENLSSTYNGSWKLIVNLLCGCSLIDFAQMKVEVLLEVEVRWLRVVEGVDAEDVCVQGIDRSGFYAL